MPTTDLGDELPPLSGTTVRRVGSPAQMWDLFEVYEQDSRANDQPLTLAGAALALGFSSTKKFYEYSKRPEFADVIDYIKTKVEAEYEQRLHGPAAAGAIFWLKAQAGYRDRLDIGNPEGEQFKTSQEHSESELELIRRVGFLIAKRNAVDAEYTELDQATSKEQPDDVSAHDVQER